MKWLNEFRDLFRLTISSPRAGMAAVFALNLSRGAGISALALMAIVSSLLLHLLSLGLAKDSASPAIGLMGGPVMTAVFQFIFLMITAQLIFWIGRARGGQGDLTRAILVVAWLEAIMLIVQVVQILIMLVLPGLAPILALATIGIFLWFMCNFIAEAHSFKSVGMVLLGVILTVLAFSLILSFIITAILGPEVLQHV